MQHNKKIELRSSSRFPGMGALAKKTLLATALASLQVVETAAQTESASIEEVLVYGSSSRISDDLSSVPGTVKVISAADIEAQSLFSNDLGDILAREIPGYGVSSSASFSNFGQTMRGRKPAVFIDGIPTVVPLRDAGRDLRLISPGAIGQVEVISGSTAIYGLGGAGGLINFATRNPGEGDWEFQTDVSLAASVVNSDDSSTFSLQQSASGRSGRVTAVFSGYYESYESLFDAEGDRIPPDPQGQGGIAETVAYNLFGKLGFDISEDSRVFVGVNTYKIEADQSFVNGVGVFGSRPAPAVPGSPPGDDQSTENSLAYVTFQHDDLFGSSVNAQVFVSDYEAVFGFFPNPIFPPNGGQSFVDADRMGIRFDVNTPIDVGGRIGNLLWGLDYVVDETSQPLTDGRLLMPAIEQTSLSPFIQGQIALADWIDVVGGFRWENAEIQGDTFTTIPIFPGLLPGGNTVQGGTLEYDEPLFNIGVVFHPFEGGRLSGLDIYTGFSQGFTVNDFGRALRATTEPSLEAFNFEAQVTDSFEIGLRYSNDTLDASIVGYQSESNLGGTFNIETLELVRAPEEVWGLEASIDVSPSENSQWGASLAWVDGEREDEFGVAEPLDTSRIAPLKFVAYVEHTFANDWKARGQLTHSGRQQRFDDEPLFGRADVESFTLIDVSVNGSLGPGRAALAISNLLNEFYFTPDAFRNADPTNFTSGIGTMARFTYTLNY
ncbi:MAG: TonB-dependent receptor [Pseudomonadota bacterium]